MRDQDDCSFAFEPGLIMIQKILIIDDDQELCEELAEILRDSGYQAFFVTDGREGKKLVAKEKFDAVILDLKLPHYNGFELLKFFKTNGKNFNVLVLSGRPMQDAQLPSEKADSIIQQEEEILQMADVVLNKPFHPEKLLAVLKDLLARNTSTNK